MGPDDHPVRLRRLQLDGEALRPDGFLGIVLVGFVLLSKELADVLHGAFIGTREGTLRIGEIRSRGIEAMPK